MQFVEKKNKVHYWVIIFLDENIIFFGEKERKVLFFSPKIATCGFILFQKIKSPKVKPFLSSKDLRTDTIRLFNSITENDEKNKPVIIVQFLMLY